jgi:hypothetical protein
MELKWISNRGFDSSGLKVGETVHLHLDTNGEFHYIVRVRVSDINEESVTGDVIAVNDRSTGMRVHGGIHADGKDISLQGAQVSFKRDCVFPTQGIGTR